jgi:F-type H+-transporting ATPase subunit gamma
MPSLKDMPVRIAATEATQKITKAMVAASKLRRATAAAEAPRPYAERMALTMRFGGCVRGGMALRAAVRPSAGVAGQ